MTNDPPTIESLWDSYWNHKAAGDELMATLALQAIVKYK
jgi:hypothetical protein